jgi:hypothetical protein
MLQPQIAIRPPTAGTCLGFETGDNAFRVHGKTPLLLKGQKMDLDGADLSRPADRTLIFTTLFY